MPPYLPDGASLAADSAAFGSGIDISRSFFKYTPPRFNFPRMPGETDFALSCILRRKVCEILVCASGRFLVPPCLPARLRLRLVSALISLTQPSLLIHPVEQTAGLFWSEFWAFSYLAVPWYGGFWRYGPQILAHRDTQRNSASYTHTLHDAWRLNRMDNEN